ncbi:Na+:solute symporter [Marinimicrobium sp. C6131]|uniref:sodium:solute symporter family protein n=1 Tax=Marinimicrobium sp. C6131 TaxID=3022676 RepID=UPI00223D24BB|nr:sodium:solute symporter family protein [Marinimicrobium sp. C6131]UZJ44532.1 Na+:solute symporter [Marinimicrobium sp. C6131]
MKSFFAAGGAVPWWVSGLSLFMSFFSVGTFVVWGSIAYADGFVSVMIQTTMAISGLVIALVIAPAWNRTRALTAAEFISRRLGDSVQRKFSAMFLLINLFTAGAFLYPVGKIIEVTTGLPLEVAILALGVFIIAYTAVGGLWAVLVTDVLQFTVLSAAVVIVVPLSLGAVGGMSGFLDKVPEGFMALHNDEYNLIFLAAFTVYNIVFIGGNWAYVQRYTSVSSPRDARKVGWLFGGLYLLAPVVWMIPPMVYRVLDPSLAGTQAEDAYLLMSQKVVPAGLLGLILGAMIFATASSVNTTINIAAGVWTHDIYRHFKRQTSEREVMLMARFSTLVFGCMAITVALLVQTMGGIVSVVLTVAALTGAAIYLPPIWAIFSRRQTGVSILTTTIGSLATNIFLKFGWPWIGGDALTRSAEMLVGVSVPVVFLLGFELWYAWRKTSNPNYEAYLDYRATLNATADGDAASADANRYAVRILLVGVAMIGMLIAVLGVLAESARLATLLVGVVIFIPAVWGLKPLRWFAKKSRV